SPPDPSASAAASFDYSATEGGATFSCKLDAGSFTACSAAGKTYNGLADGSHTFSVRATDAATNTDATPATFTWTVDTTAPDTSLDSGPSGRVSSASASLGLNAEVC